MWLRYQQEADDGSGIAGGAGGGGGDPGGVVPGLDTGEGGDSGAAGAGGAGEGKPAGDDAAGQPGGAAKPKPGEPASMLEAITQGLKGAGGEPDAKKAPKPAAAGGVDGKSGTQPAPGEPAKPAKGAKAKGDELDLEPPAGLTPEATARFQRLTAGYKELRTTHEQTRQALEQSEGTRREFASLLKDGQVGADELIGFVNFNKAVKTGNYNQALQILDQQREILAKAAGIELPGVDLLSDFPELAAEVDNHGITRQRALELAQQRRVSAAREAQDQQSAQAKVQEQTNAAARETAINHIVAWAKQKASSDIDYAAKEDVILDLVDKIMKRYPPAQWLEEIEERYGLIRVAGGSPTQRAREPAPLRPSGGGGTPEAGSLLEAITQGLAASRRAA